MISTVLCFTFATVVYGWDSNSRMVIACSCVLTNCDMLLTFGYVWVALGSALSGPEMSSPGSQHRAGNFGAFTDLR